MADPVVTQTALSNSPIEAAFRERTPGSAELAAEARTLFPSGITHDARHLKPYGIYVERAAGPRKWDVDGNEYVDYFGGHGALLLGHAHPEVTRVAAEVMAQGTQFGANHPWELRWAEAVMKLVPSVERIRFTSSGTEATHMALRLARDFTGRPKVLRFRTHFHGWHDHMTHGVASQFDGSAAPGVLAGVAENALLADPNDFVGLRAVLDAHDDIAAAIVEPTGGSTGYTALDPDFLRALREETAKRGILLVFDEVVTGFRVAPGGAQEAFGVRPDLSTFAKILAGGLPGGAVGGRRDVMDGLDFDAAEARKRDKIGHPGTFNANPVSAAAGTTALRILAETGACDKASATAAALRERLNGVLKDRRVPWAFYGNFSLFHLFVQADRPVADPFAFDPLSLSATRMKDRPKELIRRLRLAMLVNGVDLNPMCGGLLSATHTEADIDATAAAFAEALAMLRRAGDIA
ncbi:aspartate aminotransferase family protein [Thalassobaculum fulvum]|uniref:Aspartate aminotransferase family protein n=1 Tax=Thalassobaculum fulvum TaxID=1633335 RepID=A0A918XUZ3_9PROT|nr:aminotransferase class III-fold pyridoxal phosphate-dependent enzyme [Thalassobaculum fulvum]GHD58126.1 aspartate aminotransferase family protein [Thalassobaculum fulvum]